MEEAEGEVTVDMVKAKVKQLGDRVEAAEVEEEETGEEDVEAEGAGVGAEAEASSTVGEGTTAIPGRVHSKPNYKVGNTATIPRALQLCPFSGEEWQTSAEPVVVEQFTGDVGPCIPVPASILETFQLFFTASLVGLVVEQTNLKC